MRALKWTSAGIGVLLLALVLFVAFGLNNLRGPITRLVTNLSGRELVIEGDLKPVWTWVHPRFRAEKVTFANPEWATEDFMLRADAIEASVKILPLFMGQVVVPEVHLVRPQLNLEIAEDEKKNWILDREQKPKQGKPSRFHIQALTLDEGRLKYDDAIRDHSIDAQLSGDAQGVTVLATGTYRGATLTAHARGGPVMGLKDANTPYPLQFEAQVGPTNVRADGTVTNIVQLSDVNLAIELRGKTLSDMYDVIGIALPETSEYRTKGRLLRSDHMIRYEKFTGEVGESDLAGTLQFDTGGKGTGRKRTFMHGEVNAKALNLADLGPLVGAHQPRKSGVLPDMPFDSDRWDSIDADVRIKAGTIKRPEQLPLEDLATRIQMRDKVLSLDPLEFGIAGGKLAGPVRMDGQQKPIRAQANLRVKDLSLAKLFPTFTASQASVGDINGLVELAGRGDSVAQMLGSSNGKVGLFMDGGKVSRLVMEYAALDLWGVTKVKLKGDESIDIRCAIADFAVGDGLMRTNAFVFDTAVANISGEGEINLKTEEINLTLRPQPKDRSLASLNSPLYIRGTFSAPKVNVDMKRIAGKGIGALVMGAINPLLAVLPLMKEGDRKDSPCTELIAQATTSAKAAAAAKKSAAAGGSAPSPAPKPATSSDQSPASERRLPGPPEQPVQ